MATANDPKAAKRTSKLYQLNVVEAKDEHEEKMEFCFNNMQAKLKDLSEKETHDALVAMVSQSHEDVTLGLLYGILTNQQMAPKYYRDLTLITRDGMFFFVTKLNFMLVERYAKLHDGPRLQILWFVREAIKNNVSYMESVCGHLLRTIVGGDLSPKNLWLIDTLLNVFYENRTWFDKFPLLVGNAVYCYLRSIADHVSPTYEALRKKEITFCVTLLREKMMDCITVVGRDLGRALLMVAKIPEFDKLWYDIINSPTSISPQFTGVWQLLSAKVQKRLYVHRLTFEMERKIHFFLSAVRSANQGKYLDWLQRQYLSTPESQSLRSDFIRYTLCLVHPSNEVLASDVVPRWSFLLWLLSTCTNAIEVQICRLSLFYDYLFFDPEKGESIMNIEPGILLIFHLLKTQPASAASLMDFLSRITINLCPVVADQIKSCVHTSFKCLVEKKVVASLSPLFDSTKFDNELKSVLREVFEEFCAPKEKEEDISPTLSVSPKLDLDDVPLSIDENDMDDSELRSISTIDDNDVSDNGDVQETEMPRKKERRTSQLAIWESEGVLINPFDDPAPADITQSLEQLEPSLRLLVEDLQKLSEDDYGRGERVYKVLMKVFSLDEFEEEQASVLADCLCGLFRPFFARKVFPDKIESDSDLEETLQAPIFVIFRNLCLTPEEEFDSRRPLLLLTSEMYLKQQRLGYLLLYFLKANNSGGDKMSVYRDMCKMLDDEDLDTMLLKDMALCQEDDYRLFLYLVPDIYRKFPSVAQPSSELMHLIVSTLDAVQLQDLICEIVQGNLSLFRKDGFVNLLNASLKWETIEQFFYWQFVHAEVVPLDWMLAIITKLNWPNHAEAISNILLMLKRLDKDPTTMLVRQILGREPNQKNDLFAVSALKILIDDHEERMADLISNLLTKSSAGSESGAQSKGKKTVAKSLTLDPILGHLDMFRRHNKQGHNFFSKDIVQQTLQDVKKSAPESLKTKYSELFAMMEILDSVRDSRSLRRGRKITPVSTSHHQISTTGVDSSDEEHPTKSSAKPQKKKRKVVESDSD